MNSIALCTYNGEKYIGELLYSLINQTVQPDEIVVCDDKSKDNTVAVINNILSNWNGKWQVIVNEVNLGYKKNFQKAIELCTGDIVFLCDQDDVWNKEKIQCVHEVFQNNPDAVLVFHDAQIVDSELREIEPSFWDVLHFNNEKFVKTHYQRLIDSNVVQGAACAFKKNLLYLSKPFPNSAIHDEWLALNAIKYGKLLPLNKCLLKYRQTGNNEIGALEGTAKIKIKKWMFSLRYALNKCIEELERRRKIWKTLSDKYGDTLVIGKITTKKIYEFSEIRLCRIKNKDLIHSLDFWSYLKIYGDPSFAIKNFLKDIMLIVLGYTK